MKCGGTHGERSQPDGGLGACPLAGGEWGSAQWGNFSHMQVKLMKVIPESSTKPDQSSIARKICEQHLKKCGGTLTFRVPPTNFRGGTASPHVPSDFDH